MSGKTIPNAVRKKMKEEIEEKERLSYRLFAKNTGCKPLKLNRAPCGEEDENFRNVLCPEQGLCLDFAILCKWHGFSCRPCPKKDKVSIVN